MSEPAIIPEIFEYPPSVLAPDNYAYKERHLRRPTIPEDEAIIFDEPGRVLPPLKGDHGGTCCRSHHFVVTRPRFGRPTLRVKHGGGEESWPLGWDQRAVDGLDKLPSDERYRLLWVIMDAHKDSARQAAEQTARRYEQAFVDGRLKKRKRRGSDRYKVWIESAPPAIRAP